MWSGVTLPSNFGVDFKPSAFCEYMVYVYVREEGVIVQARTECLYCRSHPQTISKKQHIFCSLIKSIVESSFYLKYRFSSLSS